MDAKIKFLILISMIFLHIIADFVLQQSWLANGKQKSWWIRNVPEQMQERYKYDYKAALLVHAFSWSFCMMIPVIIYTLKENNLPLIMIFLVFNVIMHYFFDDLKANDNLINLCIDQSLHLFQIVVTWFAFCMA